MRRRTDDRPTETYDEEESPLSFDRFPYGWGWGFPPAFREDPDGDPVRGHDTSTGDGRWEGGLVSLLLIAGVLLVVFPEPATSLLGIVLVVAGILAWVAAR